jgi:hypothetical protein
VPKLTVGILYEDKREPLDLELLTNGSLDRPIADPSLSSPGLILSGFNDRVPHGRLQVLGETEVAFLRSRDPATLDDVRGIVQLSKQYRTPFFSASSVRFQPEIGRVRNNAGVGKVTRVRASYLLTPLEFHPDLFYYGIHGVEALYAVMGRGCLRLSRSIEGDADVTTCRWKDGRVGVYYGMPKANPTQPLLTVTGTEGATSIPNTGGNEGIVRAIAEFFHTGRSPVDVAETVEVFEFMTAAQLSKERDGAEVVLAELRK